MSLASDSDKFFLVLSQMLDEDFSLHLGMDFKTHSPKLYLSRNDGDETELNWEALREMYARGDTQSMASYIRVLTRCIGGSDEGNWDKFFQ